MTVTKNFEDFIHTFSNLFGVCFDADKIHDWQSVLGNLKVEGLIVAVQDLSVNHKSDYPPRIKDIVEKYEELKNRHVRVTLDKKRLASQKNVENQQYCPLCKNSGFFDYWRTMDGKRYFSYAPKSYLTVCRCKCSHGYNLSAYGNSTMSGRGSRRFSEAQVTKGMIWRNPKTGRDENHYIPDIDDLFDADDIAIIKAKKMPRPVNIDELLGSNGCVQKKMSNMIGNGGITS